MLFVSGDQLVKNVLECTIFAMDLPYCITIVCRRCLPTVPYCITVGGQVVWNNFILYVVSPS